MNANKRTKVRNMASSMVMNVIVYVIIVIIAIFVLTTGIIGRIIPGTENAEYQKKMNTLRDLSTECDLWARGMMLRSFYSDNILYYSQQHEDPSLKDGWTFCNGYLSANTLTTEQEKACRAACVNLINVGEKCDADPSEYAVFTGLIFKDIPTFGTDAKQIEFGTVDENCGAGDMVCGVKAPDALNGMVVNREVAKSYCKYYMIPVIYARLNHKPSPLYSLDKENLVRTMCPSNVWLREQSIAGIPLLNSDNSCQCSFDAAANKAITCGIGQCCQLKQGSVGGVTDRTCETSSSECKEACTEVQTNKKLSSDCVCGAGTSGRSEECASGQWCCRDKGSSATPAHQADYRCSDKECGA